MCGIIGYIGKKNACQIAIDGLKKLEYRGYDSSGVAFIQNGKLQILKKAGKVAELEKILDLDKFKAEICIGHTRWATHGEVNDINAHPHISNSGKLAIIHNGIIENYLEIKKYLLSKKYYFVTDTDTEVLINYIEYFCLEEHYTLENAVKEALKRIKGQFAIIILSSNNPSELVIAKKNAPLVLGVGSNGYYVASDIIPLTSYTDEFYYLEDNQIAIINSNNVNLKSIYDKKKLQINTKKLQLQNWNTDKGQYDYYMLKEIFEQPVLLDKLIHKHINFGNNTVKIKNIEHLKNQILDSKRIIILACGSSLNAAILGKYILEKLCKKEVYVEQAAEFRYRNPVINNNDVILGISQSGETADTLNAINFVKSFKNKIISISNVENSSITRVSDACIFTEVGPEIGVASTKAMTGQIINILLLGLWIKQQQKENNNIVNKIIKDFKLLAKKITITLNQDQSINQIAQWLSKFHNVFYLGKNSSYPVAMEGALKLKEISYLHSEAYASSEMKHGPIALIDDEFPVVYIASNPIFTQKNLSSIKEITARKGKIISIITEGEEVIEEFSEYTIKIPYTNEYLLPILSTIVVQLLACYTGIIRGCNVDMPKNLAKSVTVE